MIRAIDKADTGERQTSAFSIRVEPTTLAALDRICEEKKLPRSAIIKKLIRDYVKENTSNDRRNE